MLDAVCNVHSTSSMCTEISQGFWPDGIYTAPTEEAMVSDILLTKELGFNMLRKHIKAR